MELFETLEIGFDVMSFMLQLLHAADRDAFETVPNTLPNALQPSADARVIIDTGRNGVADERADCSNWCNIRGAGVGQLPTHATANASFIDAYFWLKTPGESDGCTQTLPDGGTCARFDSMCASPDSIGTKGGEPRCPEAGKWFDFQIKQLAKNAHMGPAPPPTPPGKCPGGSLSACIAQCPSSGYQACVNDCVAKCSNSTAAEEPTASALGAAGPAAPLPFWRAIVVVQPAAAPRPPEVRGKHTNVTETHCTEIEHMVSGKSKGCNHGRNSRSKW